MFFNYDGESYEIIIEKKNNKNTYIRVKEDLKIYVSTSYLTPKFAIKKLIDNNRNKIIKMIDSQNTKILKQDGYYYLGIKLNIIKTKTNKPFLEDDILYINDEADIKKWYDKQTKIVFKERLDTIYNTFTKDVPYPKLVIRSMKTRWGVCNKNLQKVTLNYNLIYMNRKYLDYVIVHELSHFIHFDHSKDFWRLVSENEPNYKQIRKEMRS